jgi:hypothetical protein
MSEGNRANAGRRLNAAEDSTTGGSSKRSFGVVCHCPNISTDRDEPTADVVPIVAVVGRLESSTSRAGENLTGRVNCQGVNIYRGKAVVLLRPAIAVIDRSENTATDSELGTRASKDVTTDGIDCQCAHVRRC